MVKKKVGRPKVKDKMVRYSFTIRESTIDSALKKRGKKFIDDGLRMNITYWAHTK